MKIVDHLDKNNLHHAYLIEGIRDEVVPEIISFVETMGIATLGNPDFCHIMYDSFKIEDARNLKSLGTEKSFTTGKKIFVISINNFLLEAQNALLKIFEEPIENTHFFLIVPNADSLLKTLVSRFYLIKGDRRLDNDIVEVEKFIKMDLRDRLDFIKELLIEEDEDEDENTFHDGVRAKALKFLDSLELVLNKKISKTVFDINVFEHILKVREFLRQPGSSPKTLMESVAIMTPKF